MGWRRSAAGQQVAQRATCLKRMPVRRPRGPAREPTGGGRPAEVVGGWDGGVAGEDELVDPGGEGGRRREGGCRRGAHLQGVGDDQAVEAHAVAEEATDHRRGQGGRVRGSTARTSRWPTMTAPRPEPMAARNGAGS